MNLFNYYGLVFGVIYALPLILIITKSKDTRISLRRNEALFYLWLTLSFLLLLFMTFNFPYLSFGFFASWGLKYYLLINGIVSIIDWCCFLFIDKKKCLLKMILSMLIVIIPSILGGIITRNCGLLLITILYTAVTTIIIVKQIKSA